MIYLDSGALLKLLLPEPETDALGTFLAARAAEGHVTSALTQTEVARVLVRTAEAPEVADAAEDMLDRLLRIRITDPILRAARMFPQRNLRSLDAASTRSASPPPNTWNRHLPPSSPTTSAWPPQPPKTGPTGGRSRHVAPAYTRTRRTRV